MFSRASLACSCVNPISMNYKANTQDLTCTFRALTLWSQTFCTSYRIAAVIEGNEKHIKGWLNLELQSLHVIVRHSEANTFRDQLCVV